MFECLLFNHEKMFEWHKQATVGEGVRKIERVRVYIHVYSYIVFLF